MALVLGAASGFKIKIGTHMLEVSEVKSQEEIDVTVDGEKFTITDLERKEVAPQVYVQCGAPNPKNPPHYGRLAIEAPRSMRIDRIGGRK